jgi:hypothetical protein
VLLAIERASPHGDPFSGLAAARYAPLHPNAAVHHSKSCALMSQWVIRVVSSTKSA